ncbi:MAG: GNAT family N-acetyltransferase [Eubacteriales bacterium]|nr:GNAT family N-acetyltransferase [Eubacteriales bacterium]
MEIERFTGDIATLEILMKEYKDAIEEERLNAIQYARLQKAVNNSEIVFFVAMDENLPVAMCSISRTFSTFNCAFSGVFEDFYISPQYRKSGIARMLTDYVFSYCKSQEINTLWVGCADCDITMYQHLGFDIPLGNLLTWSAE